MRRMPRAVRAMLVVALAIAAATVPIRQAVACSCAFSGLADSIAAADVAFIGTVVAEHEPAVADGQQTARYAFDVSRSKAPLPNPYEIDAWFGNDGSCGFDMTIGEEWLIISSESQGRLETHLCTGTRLTRHLDPRDLGQIALALTPNDPPPVVTPDSEIVIPTPIIVAGVAALLVALLSLFAFRRIGLR